VDEDAPDGFLAKGSFGKVYIAEDTKTGQVVAIKKQRYPSAEAARELAFAKILASNPSVLIMKYLIRLNVEIGR
jgi:serine/threonine protein kinase